MLLKVLNQTIHLYSASFIRLAAESICSPSSSKSLLIPRFLSRSAASSRFFLIVEARCSLSTGSSTGKIYPSSSCLKRPRSNAEAIISMACCDSDNYRCISSFCLFISSKEASLALISPCFLSASLFSSLTSCLVLRRLAVIFIMFEPRPL